jgi:hypothetical protein
MGERDRTVEVDHRSARSCANSSKSTCTLSDVTGARGGPPDPGINDRQLIKERELNLALRIVTYVLRCLYVAKAASGSRLPMNSS